MGFLKPNVEKMYKKGDIKGLIKALKHKDSLVRKGAAVFLDLTIDVWAELEAQERALIAHANQKVLEVPDNELAN